MEDTYPQGLKDRYLQLLKGIKPKLQRVTYRLTHNVEHSKELYHDTVSEGFILFPRLKKERAFPAFMYQIADRLNLNWITQAYERYRDHTPIENFYDRYVSDEMTEQEFLLAVFDELDETDQRIIELYSIMDSYEQIAETLGITVKAVESKLYRARQHYRKLLARYGVTISRKKLTSSTSDI